jgi:hypothetical protein
MLRFVSLAVLALAVMGQGRQWVEQAVIDGDPVVRGLAKDGIPAIDDPVFVTAREATFMVDEEYVLGVIGGSEKKAYSTWLLNAHEIVNDRIGRAPIAVTW